MGEQGYSYDPAGLRAVAGHLRAVHGGLRGVADRPAPAPDAGASSQAVGQALADLIGAAHGIAGIAEGMASNVHAANGSYGRYENTAKGEVSKQIHEGAKKYPGVIISTDPINSTAMGE